MRILFVLIFALIFGSLLSQPDFCINWVKAYEDGSVVHYTAQMQGTSEFGLGDHNIYFSYDIASVSSPELLNHNLSGPGGYSAITVVDQQPGLATFNAEYDNAPTTNGALIVPVVTAGWVDLFTVKFDNLKDSLPNDGIAAESAGTIVFTNTNDVNDQPTFDENCDPFVLPVELVFFDANLHEEDQSMITWQTAFELRNDHFELERSINGFDFEQVAMVKGAGKSYEPRDYEYIDEFPFGVFELYYRLKQVDVDGGVTFSEVKRVRRTPLNKIEISPNPVADWFRLAYRSELSDQIMHIEIYSPEGFLARKHKLEMDEFAGSFDVSMSGLAPGFYTLKIRGTNWQEIARIMKVE